MKSELNIFLAKTCLPPFGGSTQYYLLAEHKSSYISGAFFPPPKHSPFEEWLSALQSWICLTFSSHPLSQGFIFLPFSETRSKSCLSLDANNSFTRAESAIRGRDHCPRCRNGLISVTVTNRTFRTPSGPPHLCEYICTVKQLVGYRPQLAS